MSVRVHIDEKEASLSVTNTMWEGEECDTLIEPTRHNVWVDPYMPGELTDRGQLRITLNGIDQQIVAMYANLMSAGGSDKRRYEKTVIGGLSKNSFSTCAKLLRKGLPHGVSVHHAIFWEWTRKDLLEYVMKIEKALRKHRERAADKAPTGRAAQRVTKGSIGRKPCDAPVHSAYGVVTDRC